MRQLASLFGKGIEDELGSPGSAIGNLCPVLKAPSEYAAT